ncbi:hypothetical protein [Pontixanthobacter sp. CEM42]|uniref:hypothetical protein n=1 Tax=Pontixanthobacter sp. CEM42 TaxID=2792077 RepID=UPI001AE07A61|nr:hypothetical protein [Pontixanthobacter sp. CEM42]
MSPRAVLAISGFTALILAAAGAQANTYRKVDSDGVGNCVFSDRVLNKGAEGDAAYRASKVNFSEGEDVFVRCYFAKPLGEYARSGKIKNSLREGEYYADLELRSPTRSSQGPDIVGGMQFDYAPHEARLNQQRFDIGSVTDCDFRLPAYDARVWGVGEDRCPNLTQLTRAVGKKRNAAFPFTAKYCVSVMVQFADVVDERRELDGNTNTIRVQRSPRLMNHRLSESCFDYTVSS